jgi:tetratricopeptide (TPR) repeat protein
VCASSQKKIEKAKENDPEYQYNLGLFYLREGNLDEAIRYINKALALKPEYDNALCTLGLAYSMKGEFQASINYLKQCLNINPRLTEAHNYLGVAYQQLGFLDEAEKEFRIAILDPNYQSKELPYYNLARIYFSKDKLEDALQYVNMSLTINKNFRLAHNMKGMILEKQLNYAGAIESYKLALKNLQADSSAGSNLAVDYYVTINFNLGVAYFKNDELQKAKEIFTKIYPRVTDAEMRLKIDQYLKIIK